MRWTPLVATVAATLLIVAVIILAVLFTTAPPMDRCEALRHDCYDRAPGLDPQTHAEICLRASECEADKGRP